MLLRRIYQFFMIFSLGLILLLMIKYVLGLSDYVIPGPPAIWHTGLTVIQLYLSDVLNTLSVAIIGQVLSIVMALLVGVARLVTWNLSDTEQISRWQNLLEIVVTGIEQQIEEIGLSRPEKYLGFLGTLARHDAAGVGRPRWRAATRRRDPRSQRMDRLDRQGLVSRLDGRYFRMRRSLRDIS